MPNVRVKVQGSGNPTTKVEIPLEQSFDAGLAAILNAACLEAHADTWLSLNKKARDRICETAQMSTEM